MKLLVGEEISQRGLLSTPREDNHVCMFSVTSETANCRKDRPSGVSPIDTHLTHCWEEVLKEVVALVAEIHIASTSFTC